MIVLESHGETFIMILKFHLSKKKKKKSVFLFLILRGFVCFLYVYWETSLQT